MNYRLAVLTHGDATHLQESIDSFTQQVHPAPADTVLVIDGATAKGRAAAADLIGRDRVYTSLIEPQAGFCIATKTLWDTCAAFNPVDFVFWLEADFVFNRPVDLRPIAEVLDAHPSLAQMSLMRNPVNDVEKDAGSLVAAYPDWYQRASFSHGKGSVNHYMRQRIYFSTNPSLIPYRIIAGNQWPTARRCEGVFSHQLMDSDERLKFGVWGWGEPWVEHVGTRTGFGY